MKPDHWDSSHIHKTLTYGTRRFNPEVVVMTLRGRPERFVNETDEQRDRVVKVVGRWVERYCSRRGLAWDGLRIGPVGGDTADALVASFVAVPDFPEDWLCFGGVVTHYFRQQQTMMPVFAGALENLFEMDVEPDPDDEAPPVH